MARPAVGSYFGKVASRRRGGRRPSPGSPGAGGGLIHRVKDVLDRARAGGRTSARRGRGGRTGATAPRRATTAKVTIEYSPKMDGDPDPGDVVWTWVPFEEDPTQGKDRPVVVIGRRGTRLVGIPLTTKADDREVQVGVGTGGWDADRRTSYARIWRLLEIDERRMRREGAVLERDRFDAVTDAVADYYDVVAAQPAESDRSPARIDDDS